MGQALGGNRAAEPPTQALRLRVDQMDNVSRRLRRTKREED
jgi:hypothetical protein